MNKQKNAFSIELKHKSNVKTFALSNNGGNSPIMEGFLGELISVNLVESALLEIQGINGIFRIDLEAKDIGKCVQALTKEGKQ